MPYRTTAQQYAALKATVGRSNESALVPDALLEAVTFEALTQINADRAIVGQSSFETVADQATYTVTLPDNSFGLRAVFWPDVQGSGHNNSVHCCKLINNVVRSVRAVDELGNFTIDEPSLIAAVHRLDTLAQVNLTSGAIIAQPNQVRLSPPPTVTGLEVFYTYTAPRYATIEDVAAPDYLAYIAFARHRLHEALSTGQGGITSVSSETGIRVDTRASQAHAEASKRALDEYMMRQEPHRPFRSNL